MVARAYTVDARGRKRLAGGKRERLLDSTAHWSPKARRAFLRLLRAHERELAERCGDVAANTLNEMEAELLMPGDADVERVWRVRLRAAILGQPRAKKGGR